MNDTPNLRLTPRDIQLIQAVHRYRVLRRDQLQQLFFPSKNTANGRLKLLSNHGYLARRRQPVEYGQGSGQALYMLATRGATLVAEGLGLDIAQIGWRRSHNHVSSPFLEHTLMVNQVRLAVELACAKRNAYQLEDWLREEELKATPDRVWIETAPGRRRPVALVPDAYLRLIGGSQRACFCLEADRATEAHGRWAQKVLAYLAYLRSGAYARRYGSHCLRVLTVTTSPRRLENLLRTTERAAQDEGRARLFWFSLLEEVEPVTVLSTPIWHVPGRDRPARLMARERNELPIHGGAPQLLFAS